MNTRDLDIISNEILQEKLKAEVNLEYIILDKSVSPEAKIEKIKKELGRLKDSSLMLSYWESFTTNNLIIPQKKGE
jgi:hypothetical protein